MHIGVLQDVRCNGASMADGRRDFRSKALVHGIDLANFRLQVRRRNVGGKLAYEEVGDQHAHADEQHHRNHADKHVGDDQPVSQRPHQTRAHPPQPHKNKKKTGDPGQEPYPALDRRI